MQATVSESRARRIAKRAGLVLANRDGDGTLSTITAGFRLSIPISMASLQGKDTT
jgi:hypothetical protein